MFIGKIKCARPFSRCFTTYSPLQMEDWQIVSHIQQSLKEGQVHKALTYLINVQHQWI